MIAWGLTRIVLLIAAVAGGSAVLSGSWTLDGYLGLWDRWETPFYESIAELGYAPVGEFAHNAAYFPGLAVIFAGGLALGVPAPLTGIVISLAGSAAAVLALARLTRQVGGVGLYGVIAWTLSPVAVFLVAPWAEAVFAAFGFWAWLQGRRGSWIAAGFLAAGAAAFRVNGIFLGVGLIVMFLVTRPIPWRQAWALTLPLLVTAAYFLYLWSVTGDPRAWFTAQQEGWERQFTDPVTSLLTTIDMIWSFNDGVGAPHSRFVIEIAAVVVLLGLGVIMLVRRWWAEAVLVLLTVASLATSTYYYSVPRTAVVLVPVWMLIGVWMTRHRWFRVAYIAVSLPAVIIVTMRFAQGQWIS